MKSGLRPATTFKIIFFLMTVSVMLEGCLPENEKPLIDPGVIYWEERLDLNKYITLKGNFVSGNPVAGETPYDLNFYYVDSSEVVGVRGGYYKGEGVTCYLYAMDLGEIKFEAVDKAVRIDSPSGAYRRISTERIYSDTCETSTLFRLNHVYLIYKWSKWGGNYMKLLVSEIDKINNSVFIRAVYQQRPGYLLFEWPEK